MSTKYNIDGAAQYLGVSRGFLDKLRMTGGGPKFLKLGRKVAYEHHALDAWLDSRRMDKTPVVSRNIRRGRPSKAGSEHANVRA